MAEYPLGLLLRARRYREEAAAREALSAQRRLEEAREAEAAAREKLDRYREWRPGEEDRLFEELRGREIPQEELDRHREDIQSLRQTELALEESLREAEKAVAARAAEWEEAKRRRAAAVRDLRKLESHRDIWRRQEAKRLEAREEAVLEDFSVRSPDDGDGMETTQSWM